MVHRKQTGGIVHISRSFRTVALVCLFAWIYIGVTQHLSTPEGNQKMLQDVRTMPGWQFWGFILLMFLPFILVIKTLWRDLPRAENQTKMTAEEIAKLKWYVKGASVFEREAIQWLDSDGWRELEKKSARMDSGAAVLRLDSHYKRMPLTLPIRPGHPSIGVLRSLTYLDIVEFDFVEKPLECALKTELCAYLVLKK